jgi:hypothetical protein
MARTVVPPVFVRGGGAQGGDGLPEKFVKYVPAETLAFFVPTAAALGTNRDGWLIAAIIVGALGTVGYLWTAAQREDEDKRPLPYFYFLAVIAYLCWALGTSGSVADLVHADRTVAGVILGAGVFLIPLADSVALEIVKRQRGA